MYLLQILSCIDDPKVLARASQVSQRWRELLADDVTWMKLCAKHDYGRRMSDTHITTPPTSRPPPNPVQGGYLESCSEDQPSEKSPPSAILSAPLLQPNSRSFDSTMSSS